ncbi:GatB/YqeY domain-containing protein [Candidatus Uhrbacteria bacterium]|nr:GatB/YqeY domain-containing protein [Candidatus Uhrbacteria bacterium]
MLSERIHEDLTSALKQKDAGKLSTLRLLQSAMKYRQIEVGHALTDEEATAVIQKELKALKDGLVSYESAAREDLSQKARAEIATLEAYLPAQASDSEIETVVRAVIEETGAKTKADIGKVIGAAVKRLVGRADGARVRATAEKILV